ncbi:hypothetical protein E8E13_003964 [Curvularia kusanoi]|uniref:Uncharacterized protein n=1 Tax=Curvularia kusanoi TaxID=90978 RepID=A0A9P4TKN9_CURKU|nr:hypothetical protein E8E13_003964 [Curvularia kusanoi]
MADVNEDEVDWSDGTIDDPPSTSTAVSKDFGYISPVSHDSDGLDPRPKPYGEEEYAVPLGTSLPSAKPAPPVKRAQRARIGVRLNRRAPSELDYRTFALYQANQKSYEAAFLRHFANHALDSAKIERCLQEVDASSSLQKYITSVLTAINAITNKMTWNAHGRVINLLANTGQERAPFWDIHSIDHNVFNRFDPDRPTLIAREMNESWHRSARKPPMVRYTTKDYPVGQNTSPFEEIDEVANTLFNQEAFVDSLPRGRSIKQPTSKGKGRGLPGAGVRDLAHAPRINWIAPLVQPVSAREPRVTSTDANAHARIANDALSTIEPIHQDVHCNDHDGAFTQVSPIDATSANHQAAFFNQTQPQQPLDKTVPKGLGGHSCLSNSASTQEQVSQVLERALPDIRAVIAEAISKGYHPVDSGFEDRGVDIEAQEPTEAARPKENQQMHTAGKPQESKKRKTNQVPPIRMFNQPLSPPKKKRKIDATLVRVMDPITASGSTQTPRTRKVNFVTADVASGPKKQNASTNGPHPSGSAVLEDHQELPPNAYFDPMSSSEEFAWRCGIKHAMGYYYNAGDRRNCAGCFTSYLDNPKAKTMDFYLPSYTHFFQTDPSSTWRPSKRKAGVRRSRHLSHNSIAKDAWWSAINSGLDEAAALIVAINAVEQHLASKVKREPTPPPTPTPSPEPDLGPHPSGSATMEHGQDLPTGATFTRPTERHAEFAWRCDVNHALGRYYLAGDRLSCPGCGSNKKGPGKRSDMDFYLPSGVAVRQDVAELKWKPKAPYKKRDNDGKSKKSKAKKSKNSYATDNQYASRMYWDGLDNDLSPTAALRFAIEETVKRIEECEEKASKAEHRKAAAAARNKRKTRVKSKESQQGHADTTSSTALNALRARNRKSNKESESDTDDSELDTDEDSSDAGESHADEDMGDAGPAEQIEISSEDETSSESEEE